MKLEQIIETFVLQTKATPVKVSHVDDKSAVPKKCYSNAKRYAELNNAQQVSGWVLQRKYDTSLYFMPHYWVKLSSGSYVDVIPQEDMDISLYLLDNRLMEHPLNGQVMLAPLLVEGNKWSFCTDITNNTLVPCVSLNLDYLFDSSKVIYK
jgi:hypothetical protein